MRNRQQRGRWLTALIGGALASTITLGGPAWAANSGDPSEVNLKVYGAWVSADANCEDPVQIFSNASASAQNMMANPTFGSGTIANGTYPCVIFKISDTIGTKSGYNSTGGHCVQGNTYSQDVFRTGDVSTCPDGTTATGDLSENTPCVYFRVGSAETGHGFGTGDDAIAMSGPWTVSADTDATFVMNFTNKLIDDGSTCGVDPPAMQFR